MNSELGIIITQTDPERLKMRNVKEIQICMLSASKDHYEVVRDSDKLITV